MEEEFLPRAAIYATLLEYWIQLKEHPGLAAGQIGILALKS
jgi:hypothetical protein